VTIGRSSEEVANTATHAIGALASITGGAVLIVLAALRGTVWDVVGVAVFAACLVLLYLASTLYHAIQTEPAKQRLKMLDHCAIYFLIAGTYTPFMIGTLRGGWGWSLFGVIWGLAVAGVVFKLLFIGRFPRLSTGIYIAMGWLIILAAVPLTRALEPATVVLLVAGGIAYTSGTIFYHSQRLPFAHAVWHLFVIGGSVCHAIAVGMQIQGNLSP
jgi:hemolysin III